MYRNRHFVTALLAVGLMALASGVSAASGDFDVRSFIPEHFKDARLYTDADLYFSGSDSKNESDSSNGSNYLSQFSDYKNHSYRANIGLQHDLRYITIPLWYEISSELSPGWNTYHSDNNQRNLGAAPTNSLYDYRYESDRNTYNLNWSESIDAGQYLDGDWFLAGSASLRYSYSEDSKDENSQTTVNQNTSAGTVTETYNRYESASPGNSHNFNLDLMVAPGFGRIYDGVYAFLAISMVEQLQAKNQLKRMPTHDEMLQLTEIIYQRYETHAIDYRLFQIESLDMIMNYLKSIGAIDVSGPESYSLIQDVWDYYPTGPHEFGWKLRAGVGVDYRRSSYQYNSLSDQYTITRNWPEATPTNVTETQNDTSLSGSAYYSKEISTMPYFSALLQYRHPINNNWQFDVDVQGWYYFSEQDSIYNINRYYDREGDTLRYYNEQTTKYDRSSHYRMELSARLRYFLDERTSLYGTMTIANESWDQDRIVADTNTSTNNSRHDTTSFSPGGIELYLNSSLEYRIAIPTTFYLSVYYNRDNVNSYHTFPGEQKNWNWSVSTSIRHYLF